MAGAALGLAYVLRGVGDAQQRGGSVLSWLSPIGWVQQTRAYVDLRWWPLLLEVVLAAVLASLAYLLSDRRDVGAGMLRASAGRADARPALLSPVGLTARLERGTIIGWAAGLLVFAVLTGSMAQAVVDGFREQPQLAELFGRGEDDLLRSTLSAFLSFYAMAVAVFAVVVTNRLAREESEGRTGAVLATGVSRTRWLAGSLVVTTLASALLLLVAGAGVGIGAGSSVGDPSLVGQFAVASLAYLPLVLCFTGLALVAHGLGTGTWWLWTVLVASIVVGLYGPLFDLPQPVLDAAPFGLVPALPDEPAVTPLVLMVVVAGALVAAGTGAYRRRDLVA
jgi:ABC-2 type transport system permease protein